MNINTGLMLRTADEIEAHPERYDQTVGIPEANKQAASCPLCVAGNALRIDNRDLHAVEEWSDMECDAAAALGLSDAQGGVLFSSSPRRELLAAVFPHVTRDALERIPELKRWTIDDEGRSAIRAETNPRRLSFDDFWRRATADDTAWSVSAAKMMAAVLRLIPKHTGKAAA